MPSRIYSRCLEGCNIRLLKLLPGAGADPIHATLVETSIDHAPPFEALSYVWGSADIKGEVKCDGWPLQITASLHAALHGLRHPAEKRFLWADAICINQDDLDERAHQVGHMRDIYRLVRRVVVWLGPEKEDDHVPLAFELMTAIYEVCVDYTKAEGHEDLVVYANSMQPFQEVTDDQIDQALITSTEAWGAVRQFYDRPWFTRVCGLSWEMVGIVACWLGTKDLVADFDTPPERADIAYFNAFSMFDKTQDEDDSLEERLVRFRDFEATDPRDKVYALLGLVNQEIDALVKESIVVDYTKEIWEVYADIAKMSVLRTGTLGVLSQVKHDGDYDRGNSSFPSWVPRWDKSNERMALYSEHIPVGQKWNACGDRGIHEGLRPSASGTVELSGVEFGEVTWTSANMTVDDFKEQADPPKRHPFIDIWDECAADPSPYGTMQDVIIVLTNTLAAGWTPEYLPILMLPGEERIQLCADFLALMRHLMGVSPGPAPAHDPRNYVFEDGDRKRYKVAAYRGCDERRFFRTARVVVLHGGLVPYVLRPVKDGFWFLGEAYVEDIMLGEAFDQLKETCSDEGTFLLL